DEVSAAKGKITNAGLTYRVSGNGEKVVRQLPAGGTTVSSGGMVIIYTSEGDDQSVTVPNLTGLSATEANAAAAAAGINIEFSGNTSTSGLKSYRQSVEEGKSVPAGTVVTVYFRDESAVDMASE
ncbi:MAG: PASTA domain-containing protein, partial [Clostridia bacterium]|nr:PASTA domain-containing protein [Clostridia bacterium]